MTRRCSGVEGAGETIRFAVGACSLGAVLVAATREGVLRSRSATSRTPSCTTSRPFPAGGARRRGPGVRSLGGPGRRLRGSARPRLRPSPRHTRNDVPAAGNGGRSGKCPPERPRPTARSRSASAPPGGPGGGARVARRTPSRSRSPATGGAERRRGRRVSLGSGAQARPARPRGIALNAAAAATAGPARSASGPSPASRRGSPPSTGAPSPRTSTPPVTRSSPLSFRPANARTRIAFYDREISSGSGWSWPATDTAAAKYRYFTYPLPGSVATLRSRLYPALAALADRWNEALRIETRYPAGHAAYLEPAVTAPARRGPTPLMLRYGEGDYNRLHQDLYGELVFPDPRRRFCSPSPTRLRGRRVRAHRAAAAHAVAGRGGAPRYGDGVLLSGPPPPRAGGAGASTREPSPTA